MARENLDENIEIDKSYCEEDVKNFHFTNNIKVLFLGAGEEGQPEAEDLRMGIHAIINQTNDLKISRLVIVSMDGEGKNAASLRDIAETCVLSNYQFLTYKTDPRKKENSLKKISIYSTDKGAANLVKEGYLTGTVTTIARDLVNEPVITLTAVELANRAEKLGKEFGFEVEVFNKKKIESLKMGGLLAVNFGSPLPPTFTIMEWKPKGAKNKKPIVLVGKGVVYDTGGLSLKPTGNSMDFMKSDMAGAAAVIGTLCGAGALNLPYHIIGLVPATDNRPGQNAYTPGDVIRMYDGTTVEVLNTDAEGRMILADALAYAKKYDPEITIDLATLTGAAVIAVGTLGIAMMSNASEEQKNKLKTAGFAVYERLVELPLWKEYKDQLKSDIADLKNIGGRNAGSITAGKFLEHFTDYPWIHLDIAGPAFLHGAEGYRGKNGTGTGVRLLLNFIENY
ncbi:MAG: leucyl aminopeptidase [Bacteroidia bacterium]|nr:leucyl aminopeptidase [Bacteroidia bacterium]